MLDLACGTGSITDRLLDRFPDATSTGVDLDPALLDHRRGHFAGDERVTFVTADLKDPDWARALPHDTYDAVLTATALHWLHSEPLAALYGQLAGLVRDGGVFMNADHMPDAPRPGSTPPSAPSGTPAWTGPRRPAPLDWAEWWAARRRRTRCSPSRPPRRFEIYGEHADGDMPSAAWHAARAARGGLRARPGRCGARPRTRWCSALK